MFDDKTGCKRAYLIDFHDARIAPSNGTVSKCYQMGDKLTWSVYSNTISWPWWAKQSFWLLH